MEIPHGFRIIYYTEIDLSELVVYELSHKGERKF